MAHRRGAVCKFSRTHKKGKTCKRVKGGALLCCPKKRGTTRRRRRRTHRRR